MDMMKDGRCCHLFLEAHLPHSEQRKLMGKTGTKYGSLSGFLQWCAKVHCTKQNVSLHCLSWSTSLFNESLLGFSLLK